MDQKNCRRYLPLLKHHHYQRTDTMPTDTERLDFMESYLERAGQVRTEDGHMEPVRTWSIVTAATGTMRETIDSLMEQREVLHNG